MFREKCIECKRLLPRHRISNLCRWCEGIAERRLLRLSNGGKSNEGGKHKELKNRAWVFLESMGCESVRNEARDLSGELRFVYDAVGIKDGKIIIVECGGSYKHKLRRIKQDGHTLYIWSYGLDAPFLFDESMDICRQCGHLI